MTTRLLIGGTLFFLLAVAGLLAQTGVADQAAIEQAIESGAMALRQGDYAEAKRRFERAERLAGPPSAQINAGIAMAELQMDHYDAARKREAAVLKLVVTDHERAEAYNLIGTSWMREAAQKNDNLKMLQSAEESFLHAAMIDPLFDTAYFNLGNALARQKRESAAGAAFKQSIEAASKNPAYDADLPLSPQSPAPSFSITASDGRRVSSEDLRGRFVLLDFWATWCGPCMKASPLMRQLAHYFPQNQFVLVSVNEDSPDANVWRKFVAAQNMDWAQVWDKDAEIYHNFGLAPRPDLSIPRYVLLDGNGFVRRIYDGTDRMGLVVGQVAKVVEGPNQSAKPSSTPAADVH